MKRRFWKRLVPVMMILSLLLTISPLAGLAAQPAVEPPTTGFEDRNEEEWTTHDEELAFLEELAAKSERVTYSQVGTSVKGLPIHLVRVGYPEPPSDADIAAGRNILIMGTPHGNEPSGREMTLKLMRDLAFTDDPELLQQLSEATVLFVPTPNPDGREANRRTNDMGIDNNRDHLNLETPEIQAIAEMMNQFRPDITLDAHERPTATGNPDLQMLWPRNLNVDEELRALNIALVEDYMMPDVEEAGFSTGLYGSPGGSGSGDERILRNMSGLRHGLGVLTEAPGRQAPKNRVDMQMAAAQSVLRFYSERFDDVETVVKESPQRKAAAGANQDTYYLEGSQGWDPSKWPPVELDPVPCGYLLTSSQAEDISRHIESFSLKTEKVGENGVFVTMNQPMMTVVPLLLDERATYNEVDGLPLVDCTSSAASIKALVELFEDEGEFTNDQAPHSLKVHLTAVSRYEGKGQADKVVKHMESFKLLLNHQQENGLISEWAYDMLSYYGDALIEKWDVAFDSNRAMDHVRHLSVNIGPRVAGSDAEKQAADYIENEFESLGYAVSTQEFAIRDQQIGQLRIVSNDNDELPSSVATGSAETDESGVTGNVYEAGLGQPEDFSAHVHGNIALIQRGELSFWEKVENAIAAGAAGVIIYDNTDSFAPITPSLSDNTSSIPVVGITKADGESLLSQLSSDELTANITVRTLTNQTSQNVMAVKKPKDIENPEIVYVTAHYDSVPGSPGANDNGSGTGTLLELARIMKDSPTNKEIRFVAFGSEEIGLVGARYYVSQLSQEEIDRSAANFQMDMVGTAWEPATQLYVNVVDGEPNLVWQTAKAAADKLNNDRLFLYQRGASDHVAFHEVGIDAANFIWREPGTAALEPYYHTPQDTIEHVSPERIQMVGELINAAVSDLAQP